MESPITKEEVERRAAEYIAERERTSGAPFPLEGIHRTLCIKCMAAFACGEVAAALLDVFPDAA